MDTTTLKQIVWVSPKEDLSNSFRKDMLLRVEDVIVINLDGDEAIVIRLKGSRIAYDINQFIIHFNLIREN